MIAYARVECSGIGAGEPRKEGTSFELSIPRKPLSRTFDTFIVSAENAEALVSTVFEVILRSAPGDLDLGSRCFGEYFCLVALDPVLVAITSVADKPTLVTLPRAEVRIPLIASLTLVLALGGFETTVSKR